MACRFSAHEREIVVIVWYVDEPNAQPQFMEIIMGKKLPEDTINEIIRLYQAGSTPLELAKQFNIFNNSVTRILRKRGIARTQLIQITQEQTDFMIEEYCNGVSSEIIAKKLKVDASTVCRHLIKNNIEIRPSSQNHRKYEIDQNYFETIDTEEKAYFLGFLYADGNLSNTRNGIKITLQEEDRDILERFSNIIYRFVKLRPSYGELEDGTPRTYLTLEMWCKKMHDDLIKLGCPPTKTFIIRFPTNNVVPDHLLWHFVRGVFDGDGCICITNPARPRIDFSSNLIFIQELIYFFVSQGLQCNKPVINDENPLSGSIQFVAVDQVLKCYHMMYDNATIYMNRKYTTFQEMFVNLDKHNVHKNRRYTDINNYGTSYMPDYNGQILSSKTVEQLSPEDKSKAVELLLEFYRQHGFPHTRLTNDDIIKEFLSLKKFNPVDIEKVDHQLQTHYPSGTILMKHFSPHFYEVNSGAKDRMSMFDTFNDDRLLKEVIKNRLNGNFNMTGNMLKQGLSNSKLAYKASIFNPMVAKYIYAKYTKEGDIVYDYSMGFGQRLMAVLSLNHKVKYIGVDPMQRTVDSNQSIFNFFDENIPMFNREAEIICMGSENYCDSKYENQIALAFSCPPYYDIEKYEDHTSQAYSNGNYVDFINVWWRQTMKNIVKLLKDDGIFAINIKETVNGFNIAEDMCNVARENNMILVDTYQVQITRNINFGHKKMVHKYEPIFIFKKNIYDKNLPLPLDIEVA